MKVMIASNVCYKVNKIILITQNNFDLKMKLVLLKSLTLIIHASFRQFRCKGIVLGMFSAEITPGRKHRLIIIMKRVIERIVFIFQILFCFVAKLDISG